MSGLTLITQDLSPQIRSWFGTSGADTGIGAGAGTGVLGSQDLIFGYQGNDSLEAQFSTSVQIFGGQGNDSLTGSIVSVGITRLFGNQGDDTLIGLGGATNLLSGNQGNDTIFGADNMTTVDSLNGGQGNDVLRGRGGGDYLSGDLGADVIWGDEGSNNAGNDTILGGAESDTIVGGGGNDSIRGGQGNDYIEVDNSVSSNSPSGNAYVAGNDTVNGDAGNDTIGRLGSTPGMTGTDWYNGGDGNDSIQGGNNGGSANTSEAGDTLIGGAGNDVISGGSAETTSGRDSITGGAGNDTITGGGEGIADATNPFQASQGDTISGGDGNDSIDGGAGHDSITGDAGQDTISGGNDGDSLNGGADNDSIYGGAGKDSIIGGTGADTLTGGAGSDTLIGSASTSDNDNAMDVFTFDLTDVSTFPTGGGLPAASTPRIEASGGIPQGVSQTDADYILNFRTGQDKISIASLTVSSITATGFTTNQPTGQQTVVFGRTPVIGTSAGADFAEIGQVYADTTTTAGSTILYVERDGVAGATLTSTLTAPTSTGDIILATIDATLTATDFI